MDELELRLDEAAARRVLLVRAIEEADPQGRVWGDAEREQEEAQAAAAVRAADAGGEIQAHAYLKERTGRLLAAAERRQPALVALQQAPAWRRPLAWGLPLLAALAGAALDRIDNPGHVNMLSPPLLAVVLWNLLAYAGLLLALFWRGPGVRMPRWWPGARPTTRTGRLRPDVAARFHVLWLQAGAPGERWWWQRLLHATAAGWALGLALSIVIGGLVRQYRVGWESTLLDLGQVHAFLSFLFAPVVAWLPFEAFSPQDLQRMAFAAGADPGVEEARRWVWMYLALLAMLVIVPRALLAAWAGWRRRRVRGAGVRLDLRDPYFAGLLERVRPARITLALLSQHAPSREWLMRSWARLAALPPPSAGQPWPLVTTGQGDVLQVLEIPAGFQPPAPVEEGAGARPPGRWAALMGRWRDAGVRQRPDPLGAALAASDVVLVLPGRRAEMEAAEGLLRWLGKPVLLVVPDAEDAAGQPDRDALRRAGIEAETLDLAGSWRNWSRDVHWLQAVRARLQPARVAAFERLATAWQRRSEARFGDAMRLLAGLLARAAGEYEEVAGQPGALRRLLSPAERDAAQRARETAMEAVLHRLRRAEAETLDDLARLHGCEPANGPQPVPRVPEGALALASPVNSRQAGVAGAATGAAMGAGIDLMTGGLTLGAAAALGAVLGGGASFAAAAWRNREAPTGRTQVQPGDDLLLTLAESLLLHYLAVAERSRSGEALDAPVPPGWRAEVVAAVAARRDALTALFQQARGAAPAEVPAALARELEALARGLLVRA